MVKYVVELPGRLPPPDKERIARLERIVADLVLTLQAHGALPVGYDGLANPARQIIAEQEAQPW